MLAEDLLYRYKSMIPVLLEKMLKHHNIKVSDLKYGDITHVCIRETDKEYYIIYNTVCYELVKTFTDKEFGIKLVPNQEYLKEYSKSIDR